MLSEEKIVGIVLIIMVVILFIIIIYKVIQNHLKKIREKNIRIGMKKFSRRVSPVQFDIV